ncbi:VOC family protein [Erythrobacter sp. W53]|uniref:VOC family protein n=1 Tax=Erythrobacter sp. W53 TaxID=3425947 RepID=UPI003D768F1B
MTKCYLTVGSNDLDVSFAFYDPVMSALGAKVAADYPGMTRSYMMPDGFQLWVTKPQNGEAATCGNGHTAGFHTAGTEQVDAAHAAALANGGTDEGAPGPRPLYGPDIYAAYARDPFGNKLAFMTSTDTE